MSRNLTQSQIENIVLDAAILYANYGTSSQKLIAPTKGGVEFSVSENVRDIEYDGRRGKTKGMEVVDDIAAYMKATVLDISMDNLKLALGAYDLSGQAIVGTDGGVVDTDNYLTNVVAFGICNKDSSFKKITIFNVNGAGGITLGTTDKGEAGIELTLNAHFDPTNMSSPIYKIEDDTTGPQPYTPPST